jgi:hypothetical protein
VHSTNSYDTFIAIAPDSTATCGVVPKDSANPSIARRTYQMIAEFPYKYTSDDVIFTVFADRKAIPESKRQTERVAFFSKGQPCLRASDLGKKYGWGVHCNAEGKVALVGIESPAYQEFISGKRTTNTNNSITITYAMRSSRQRG